MILLSKLDATVVLVNLESIKYFEATPDTLVHFLNGDTMLVRESLQEVEQRIRNYHRDVFNNPVH